MHFTAAPPPADHLWRWTVRGTDLRWWAEDEPHRPPPRQAVRADMHGSAVPGDGRLWQLVDAAGAPVLRAFQALVECHREPFTVSLYLVERGGAGPDGRVLAEAHLSSAVGYRGLLDAVARTSALLLRQGVREDGMRGHGVRGQGVPTRPSKPAPALPNQALRLARALSAGGAHWVRARLGGDTYGIAVLPQPVETCLQDRVLSPTRWIQIPAEDGFIADPFFWPGRPDTVLCEAYSHRTGLGRLTSTSIKGDPGCPELSDVLRTGHHLSYPCAWQDGGRVLCLPEMAAARRQILYELRDGPSMAPVCVVADGVAMADPTFMQAGGLCWIGYSDADIGAYDNLCLMYAQRPEGPWVQHPGNPVKIDVRSSRPGGTPFRVANRLFRPAQDCSRTYGGALSLNQVVECTPATYAEKVVATLRPDPLGAYPDGLHTLAVDDGRIVIDGKRVSYHGRIMLRKILRRFRRT